MKKIAVNKLKPNTFFNSPVFLDSGYIILSPEIPVSTELIRRLNDWRYIHIYSEDDEVTDTAVSPQISTEVGKGVLDKSITESNIEKDVADFYNGLVSYYDELFKTFVREGEVDIPALTSKIKEMIEQLKSFKNQIIGTLIKQRSNENYYAYHSVNTTLLALTIGDLLKFAPHKLIDLGIAAALHEIGMLKLPVGLYMTKKILTPPEKKQLAAHTVLGYKILKSLSLHDYICSCALEHHERIDGSGYPRGLRGEGISVYGRILAITCSFDGAISKRPYKKPIDGHQAMIDLLVTRKHQYDENILKALVYGISIFPPGTFVQLSNNTRGIVIRVNPNSPKFPVVKVLMNEYGEKMPAPVELQTSSEAGIIIKRVLTLEELEKLHMID